MAPVITSFDAEPPRIDAAQGQSVTLVLDLTLTLPQKMGRWGQWNGVTYLSNCLPVFAFYGDVVKHFETLPGGAQWQPTPFIPWHQPFFNEAGVYTASGDSDVSSTPELRTMYSPRRMRWTTFPSPVRNSGIRRRRVPLLPTAVTAKALMT